MWYTVDSNYQVQLLPPSSLQAFILNDSVQFSLCRQFDFFFKYPVCVCLVRTRKHFFPLVFIRLKREFDCIPAYIYDDTDNWSMNDFIDVRNGTFTKAINEIIRRGEQHVHNCELCMAHGFICEYCTDKQVIFPWQSRVSISYTCIIYSVLHTITHQIKAMPLFRNCQIRNSI